MAQKDINAIFKMAVGLFQQGRLEEARTLATKICKRNYNIAEAHHLLGVIELQAGNHESSIRELTHAARINPVQAVYYNNLGFALHATGRFADALSAFERAVQLNPRLAGAHYNIGNQLVALGRHEEALSACKRAIELKPHYVEALVNLGTILLALARTDEALAYCNQALEVNPNQAEAHLVRATVLRQLGRQLEAQAACEKAIQLKPDYVEAICTLGAIYNDVCEHEKALEACERAIAINAESAVAFSGRAVILADMCRTQEAIEASERAIELSPGNADAHYIHALLLLRSGDIDRGWQEYEWRWKTGNPAFVRRDFQLPQWDGALLRGRRLLILAEQGIGDEIMFSSCFRSIAKLDGSTVIECDQRLVNLFTRSFPVCEFIGVLQRDNNLTSRLSIPADCETTAGSLPLLTHKVATTDHQCGGYLRPDPELQAKWRKRMAGYDRTLKVGLSWIGGKRIKSRKTRSIALEDMLPLLRYPGFTLVNLQYGDHQDEIAALQRSKKITLLDWDDFNQYSDIDDLAALMSTLDLVVSVDNSIVHLAGALDINTATLLPNNPDWRWQLDSGKTDWYPSMRLFRQRKDSDWKSVIDDVLAYAESLHNAGPSK